jgi:hypothetical protein
LVFALIALIAAAIAMRMEHGLRERAATSEVRKH